MTDQPNPVPQDLGASSLPPIPKEGSSNTTKILIIVAAAAFFCLCILPVCVIVVLALLGSAVGNVFSDIIEELEATPTTSFILFSGFSPLMFMSLIGSMIHKK